MQIHGCFDLFFDGGGVFFLVCLPRTDVTLKEKLIPQDE